MTHSSRRQFLRTTAAAGVGAVAGILGPRAERTAQGAQSPVPMKLAICNETFVEWPHEKAFAFAAECGYEGIEIAPFTIAPRVTSVSQRERKELRQLADRHGLQICALHWLLAKTEGFHLTHPDRKIRQATTEYLCELARFCRDLGGEVMVFGSPQQRNRLPGISREEALRYAAEVFRGVLPVLETTGVVIGLEPLGPKETDIIVWAAEAVELAEMVDSPQVKMMLDCKAMVQEEKSIPDLIREFRDWMVHFHANDPNLQGPGMGDLDFAPIFQALREIGYRKWVSVEVFDYTPGPEALARQSIANMKEVLAKLE